MKKKLMILGGFAALALLVAVVFGFVFMGSIVKAGVEQVGPIITKTKVKLDGASVSIFSGSGELKGFELGNPEGYKTPNAIKMGSVGVTVAPMSVFSDKVVVKSVRILAPEITFETDLKGNNLSKILANVQEMAGTNAPSQTTPAGKKKALQVDEVVIAGGTINLSASIMGGKSAALPLPEIRLDQMGQGPEGITPAEMAAKVLGAITSGTLKAVAQGAAALGKDGAELAKKLGGEGLDSAKKIGTEGVKSLEKVGTGIGDLFKKGK